jgi:exodeoxyribonuclease-5
VGWEKREGVEGDLIIVDEASMVDQDIWNDLISYQIPVLAVGDHGQLPPIKGKFNLIEEPLIRLEEIHRQARDNPIIKLSIAARERGVIPHIPFGDKVVKMKRSNPEVQMQIGDLLEGYNEDTLVLCGYNNTRIKLNKHIRGVLGFTEPTPQVGDTVICLRNNHQEEIYNGMTGTIRSIHRENEKWYFADIDMSDGHTYSGPIFSEQFNNPQSLNHTDMREDTMQGDLFDFGYALTVHKAQGSQAKKVILFEERFKQMDDEMWRRWLYTGITRAEEELYIIG